ncbi:MAG TPA: bifunctional diaminohydroxyphosphoribosylaminopyrimidine deaminase/5-amino-6-(5-phosphoribosylamino)uracil reductase RibD [Tepidisphaeraceae bacterium]|jgi:diaminohydroxyphosphoribosylaminopyrimidine deaminase/5-amino-6-(5-phosphoribosylamino)uracil reductase
MSSTISDFDVQMMRRAIRLAMKGRGRVEPNPMVGCVLVREGKVIGEGYHERFGQPHAEPIALKSVRGSAEGATAYVTLEPCCHTNKKTPPCVPALIDARVKRVVVGSIDPNPNVNGKGLDELRAAGIEVTTGVETEAAKQLLAPFIAGTVYDRPYITLKWAQTADGKVAGAHGSRMQISNPASTRLVHELRARSDAIMVGINTVQKDDPLLTARHVQERRPLIRAVLDSNLQIVPWARLVTDRSQRTVIFTASDVVRQQTQRVQEFQHAGVEVWPAPRDPQGRLNLSSVFPFHDAWKPQHVLVEPGPTLAASCFASGSVDRVWVVRSAKRSNDETAPAAVEVPSGFVPTGELIVEGDRVSEYLNSSSEVFFAAESSADFVLAQETTDSAAHLHG